MIEWITQKHIYWDLIERKQHCLRFTEINQMIITRDQILNARAQRKTMLVDVPEWFDGGQVILVELSGKERDQFDAEMITVGGNGSQKLNLRNVRAKLCAKAIANPEDFELETDDKGRVIAARLKDGIATPRRLFTDIEANDLGDLSASALDRVFSAAQRLSGITKEDIKELTGELKNDESGAFGSN